MVFRELITMNYALQREGMKDATILVSFHDTLVF